MTRPSPLPRLRPALPWAVAMALAGCATHTPVEWRLQVRTTRDWSDLGRLAERVAQVGGAPVSGEVAAIAPHWYAVTLVCENRRACKHASMRLAAQRDLFVELRRDTTREGPSRPEQGIQ